MEMDDILKAKLILQENIKEENEKLREEREKEKEEKEVILNERMSFFLLKVDIDDSILRL